MDPKAPCQETHPPPLHAARRAPLVPQSQIPAERLSPSLTRSTRSEIRPRILSQPCRFPSSPATIHCKRITIKLTGGSYEISLPDLRLGSRLGQYAQGADGFAEQGVF